MTHHWLLTPSHMVLRYREYVAQYYVGAQCDTLRTIFMLSSSPLYMVFLGDFAAISLKKIKMQNSLNWRKEKVWKFNLWTKAVYLYRWSNNPNHILDAVWHSIIILEEVTIYYWLCHLCKIYFLCSRKNSLPFQVLYESKQAFRRLFWEETIQIKIRCKKQVCCN